MLRLVFVLAGLTAIGLVVYGAVCFAGWVGRKYRDN